MDKRAQIHVGPPHPNPTTSYWQAPPSPIADHRTTAALPRSADTIIIGSGITGAAVAWGLLSSASSPDTTPSEPDGAATPRVLMLEARQACSGATGRNGGHTKAASYRSFPGHLAQFGPSEAAKIARMELANIRAVHAFAREHGIACDSRECDTIDVVYDAAQWELAQAAVASMREVLGEDDPAARYELVDAGGVRERFLFGGTDAETDGVCGGVVYPAGSLSAYAFGIGVLKLCLEKGMHLQTGTLVTDIGKDGEGWMVRTTRGEIRARRVVLATNGYTASVFPRFQGAVVPMRGQITAQRPGRGLPFAGCLPTTYSFIYQGGYEYMISRPAGSRFEGDAVIGGGLVRAPEGGLFEYGTVDDSALDGTISEYLREVAAGYFGQKGWGEDHGDGRVRTEWTGIMGFTPDEFPFVGEVPGEQSLWAACGFQGHGMVFCWMCARALVEMMEGRDGDGLAEWFPQVFRITEERLAKRFSGEPPAHDAHAGSATRV